MDKECSSIEGGGGWARMPAAVDESVSKVRPRMVPAAKKYKDRVI